MARMGSGRRQDVVELRTTVRSPGLSADVVARQRAASQEAIENARLEGLPISDETQQIMDAYDRGEIDGEEMKRLVMMRHTGNA